MPTTLNGIYYPDGATNVSPLPPVFAALANSIDAWITANRTVQYVANVAARTSLTGTFVPTTSKPLLVWRGDATAGRELEVTTDGTNWYYYASSKNNAVWVNATISTGWAAVGSHTPRSSTVGGITMIEGAVTRTNATTGLLSSIITIPVSHSPTKGTSFIGASVTAASGGGPFVSEMYITSAGVVAIGGYTTMTTQISVVTPLGATFANT